MIINHNLNAMNAHRNMGINNNNSAKAMEKLSSGLRINRAGDDAAGLAISEKMRGQIRGLDQASRNAQDGISLIQTAEGALQETHSILQRMRELTVQASNDTNVTEDRDAIQKEMNALTEEIDRISKQTEFNTKKLLTGGASNVKLQVGANKDQNVSLTIGNMGATALGMKGNVTTIIQTKSGGAGSVATTRKTVGLAAINVGSQSAANLAIEKVNSAITRVSQERAGLGAMQNRLEHTISNLNNTSENLQAAESRIRDVDMAKEMMNFSKNNILNQAAQAMLAQANQQPQAVLQLLR